MDYRPLRMGDTGPAVLEVQRMLTDLGYTITQMDGAFDGSTLRAVIAFQSDRTLPIDGVVAVNTWMALRKHTGRHAESDEPRHEREEPPSRHATPPAALIPLEAPAPYTMPPLPPQTPESLPIEPRAFTVPIVPLIKWRAIHTEPEPAIPVEAPIDPPRGWTQIHTA